MLGVTYKECWYEFSSCIMYMKRCRHNLESAVVRICNLARQRGIAFCWFGVVQNQTQSLRYQPHYWTQLMVEGPKLSKTVKKNWAHAGSFVTRLHKTMLSFEPQKPIGIMFLWSLDEIVDSTKDLVMSFSMMKISFNKPRQSYIYHFKHMRTK